MNTRRSNRFRLRPSRVETAAPGGDYVPQRDRTRADRQLLTSSIAAELRRFFVRVPIVSLNFDEFLHVCPHLEDASGDDSFQGRPVTSFTLKLIVGLSELTM